MDNAMQFFFSCASAVFSAVIAYFGWWFKKRDGERQALEDIRQGRFVIAVDDEDETNPGALIAAGQMVTPELINVMGTMTGGIITIRTTPEKAGKIAAKEMTCPLILRVYRVNGSEMTMYRITGIGTAEGKIYSGLILERMVEADTAMGPWKTQLLIGLH